MYKCIYTYIHMSSAPENSVRVCSVCAMLWVFCAPFSCEGVDTCVHDWFMCIYRHICIQS